jgi:phospholipid:diacylglycerol acyltransferase
MSFLRRRFGGNGADSSSEPSREPTPEPGRPSNLRVVTAEKLHTLKKGKKNGKRKNFWIFALGGLAGVVAAAFFAGSNDMIDFSSLEGVNLDSLYEALPAGFLKDAQQMQVGTEPPCAGDGDKNDEC